MIGTPVAPSRVMQRELSPATLNVPVLELPREVMFPGTTLTLTADARSQPGLDAVGSDRFLVAVQRRIQERPAESIADVYAVGTLTRLRSLVRASLDDQPVIATIEGLQRTWLTVQLQVSPYMLACVRILDDVPALLSDPEIRSDMDHLRRLLDKRAIRWRELFGTDAFERAGSEPSLLADIAAAALLGPGGSDAQRMLETIDVRVRLRWLCGRLGTSQSVPARERFHRTG